MTRVLCLHGTGGTAATMQPVVDGLRAAGHHVEAPTLPGHGGVPEDLFGVTWSDWLAAASSWCADVVIGQSMGASLALALGSAGACRAVVAINALAPDPDALDGLEWRRERGSKWIEVGPSTVGEIALYRLPIETLITTAEGVLAVDLAAVSCPLLLITSEHDDVVDPASSDVIAAMVTGPVERVRLQRSGHVASLDVERELVISAILHALEAWF